MEKKEFIEKAKQIHGDKYDYSKVNYINNRTKVCIICKKHGDFWQLPYNHLSGAGCKKCAGELSHEKQSLNTEEFVKRSIEKYGEKFLYNKTEYVNSKTKICITCKKHGDFWTTPERHLRKNGGCKFCQSEKTSQRSKKPFEIFVKEAIKKFGDNFIYDEKTYGGISKKTKIVCKKHGEFYLTGENFLKSLCGCPKCQDKVVNYEKFLKKARLIHGDKYDYPEFVFESSDQKIPILCKEHGEFFQSINSHLCGHGCPACKTSMLETQVKIELINNNINFICQYKENGMGRLSFDFYLPDYNIAIECQGRQHFEPVKAFGGISEFKKIIERDKRKKEFCDKNGIKLLYYTNIISEKTVGMHKTIGSVLNEIKQH